MRLHLGQNRAHVANGTVTQKRHGTMGNPPLGFDFRPPDTAMAQTNAIFVQGFGDDHMLHAVGVEIPLFRQIGDTAIAAAFFIRRRRNLDRALVVGVKMHKRFGGNDRRGQPALHIAGAATVNLAVFQLTTKRVFGPTMADLDHIMVRIEMNAVAGCATFVTRDHVPTRVFHAVANRPLGADHFDLEPGFRQPFRQIGAYLAIIMPRRVQRGNADQVLGQGDQIVPPGGDFGKHLVSHGHSLGWFTRGHNGAKPLRTE